MEEKPDVVLRLVVWGTPVAKGRARVFRDRTGRNRAITPEKTRRWEDSIKLQAIAQMKNQPPIVGAIHVTMEFYRPFPKSISKKNQATAQPTTKPDLSNYIKAVEDALNGIAWRDDSQIVRILASKSYLDTPGVIIEVKKP